MTTPQGLTGNAPAEPFVERIYLTELATQCDYAIGAAERINSLLNTWPAPTRELFREIAGFLQHAASVSRLLWPPGSPNAAHKARAEARGDHLRQILAVPHSHALRARTLRDHLEHFDYRLDDWAESSRDKIVVDHHVGPRASIGGDVISDADILRLFDPATSAFVFRGETFNIQDLADGIVDIRERVAQRVSKAPDIKAPTDDRK